MRKWSAGIAALVLLSLACVSLAGCGGGGERTRAAAQPTESLVSGLGKLAYELDGVIYVKDLPDGEAVRLTEGSEPHWSPSGQWLLFSSEDSDLLIRADGTDRHALPNWLFPEDPRIMPSAAAAWSPKADALAYATDGALFVENADGSGKQEVTPIETYPWGLMWSADGTRLAYVQQVEAASSGGPADSTGIPINRRASLWVVDVEDGAEPAELYATTADGIVAASWLGDDVLFWLDVSFSASAFADGLPLEAISAKGGGQPRELAWGPLSGWSPSPVGDRVAMTVPPGRESWTQKRIAVIEPESGTTQYLMLEDMASIDPAWSADGSRIAFVSKPDVGEGVGGPGFVLEEMAKDRRIWLMNSDGSDQRQLTDDASYRDERPLWSADGSQILFARLDSDRYASLWLIPSSGGAPRRVVDAIESSTEALTGYYTNIDWDYMYDWWQGP